MISSVEILRYSSSEVEKLLSPSLDGRGKGEGAEFVVADLQVDYYCDFALCITTATPNQVSCGEK